MASDVVESEVFLHPAKWVMHILRLDNTDTGLGISIYLLW